MTMIKLLRTFNSAVTQQVSGRYSQRISDTYLGGFCEGEHEHLKICTDTANKQCQCQRVR